MTEAWCELASCVSIGHSDTELGFVSPEQKAASPTATERGSRVPDLRECGGGGLLGKQTLRKTKNM